MIKLASALIILLSCRLETAIAAGQSPCPPLQRPMTVMIKPFDSPLSYLFNYSESQMTSLMNGGGKQVPSTMHLHGLTAAGYSSQFEFQYYELRAGNGWCLAPVSVTTYIGFTNMKIYVDSKYPSGSCPRHAVLIHEAKHVSICYEEMNAGIPQIEAELRRALATSGFPIYVSSLEAGRKYIHDYLNYYIARGFDRINQRIQQRNLALDSPQEYAAIAAMCPNW